MENFDQLYLDQRLKDFTVERNMAEVDFIVECLKPSKGAKIVDFCCGHGRHSEILASRGYSLVGYDLSDFFINFARRENPNAVYIKRDLVQFTAPRSYEVGYCFFSSFGFYEDADNHRMLANMLSSVEKRFLLNVINREWLIQNLADEIVEVVKKRAYILYPQINLEKNLYIKNYQIFEEKKLISERVHTIQLYCLHEYKRMFMMNGWKPIAYYGIEKLPLEPYTKDSRWLSIVVERCTNA